MSFRVDCINGNQRGRGPCQLTRSPDRFASSIAVLLLFALILFSGTVPAYANAFRDFIIYPYETPEQGEVSIGTWQSVLLPSKIDEPVFGQSQINANILWSTYVFEFGVTDWWTLGTYVDFLSGAGQTYSYYQTRAITSRFRFPRIPDFIDPAIQIEYWTPAQDAQSPSFLDLILIGEKRLGRFVVDVNAELFFETANPVGATEGLPPEFGYAAGLYYLLAENVNFGVEAFGETGPITNMYGLGGTALDEVQQHYIFQSWNFAIGEHIDWNIGIGTGLTEVSAPLAIKTIFEYHFKPLDFGEKEGEHYKEIQNIH